MTCHLCHDTGYTAAQHIVGSAYADTITACACPAGQAFKQRIAEQSKPRDENDQQG